MPVLPLITTGIFPASVDNSSGTTPPPDPQTQNLDAKKTSVRKLQRRIISTKYSKKISPSKKVISPPKKTQDLRRIYKRIEEKRKQRSLMNSTEENY